MSWEGTELTARIFKARLNRWLEVVLFTVIGSFSLALFGTSIFHTTDDFILHIANKDDYSAALAYLCVAGVIAIGFLYYFLQTRISHLKYSLEYPPLPTVVVFSFAIAPFWQLPFRLAGDVIQGNWHLAFFCSAISAIIWLFYAFVFGFVEQYFSSGNSNEIKPIDPTKLGKHPLIEWLHEHDPISDKSRDLFDHIVVADRLQTRLQQNAQSIALLGPYGAGKSSVCRMLEQKSGDFIVKTSCWGFSNPERIQKQLLENILNELAKHTDCFRLRTLP